MIGGQLPFPICLMPSEASVPWPIPCVPWPILWRPFQGFLNDSVHWIWPVPCMQSFSYFDLAQLVNHPPCADTLAPLYMPLRNGLLKNGVYSSGHSTCSPWGWYLCLYQTSSFYRFCFAACNDLLCELPVLQAFTGSLLSSSLGYCLVLFTGSGYCYWILC